MNKENWSATEVAKDTDGERIPFEIPAGAYIVKIVNAVDTVSKSSGSKMLVLTLDVAEGEYTDFARKAEDKTGNDYSYKTLYAGYEGTMKSRFALLLQILEISNRNFSVRRWQQKCDERELIDLKFGVVMDESYNDYNPEKLKIDSKPNYFKIFSTEDYQNGKYKKPKLVTEEQRAEVEASQAAAREKWKAEHSTSGISGSENASTAVNDEELPF